MSKAPKEKYHWRPLYWLTPFLLAVAGLMWFCQPDAPEEKAAKERRDWVVDSLKIAKERRVDSLHAARCDRFWGMTRTLADSARLVNLRPDCNPPYRSDIEPWLGWNKNREAICSRWLSKITPRDSLLVFTFRKDCAERYS